MSLLGVKIDFIIGTAKCGGNNVWPAEVWEDVIEVDFSVKRVMAVWVESATFVVYL